MKRFQWSLQRVLDVTRRREQAAEAAMGKTSREILTLRTTIIQHEAQLRASLGQLNERTGGDRLLTQELFMRTLGAEQRRRKQWEAQIATLQERRERQRTELLELRTKRKSLERLRETALERYTYEQDRIEQNEIDDRTNVAYARGILAEARGA